MDKSKGYHIEQGDAVASANAIVNGVKGWSWGAFLFTPFWAVGNRVWVGLLALVPVIGFIVSIYMGAKGRELAWKSKKWRDFDHFSSVQRNWSVVAVITTLIALGVGAYFSISNYSNYVARAKESGSIAPAKTYSIDPVAFFAGYYSRELSVQGSTVSRSTIPGNRHIRTGDSFAILGTLMQGQFEECCDKDVKENINYYYLIVDEKFDIKLDEHLYIVDIDKMALTNSSYLHQFNVGEKYLVMCGSVKFGAGYDYPLPIFCKNPTLERN